MTRHAEICVEQALASISGEEARAYFENNRDEALRIAEVAVGNPRKLHGYSPKDFVALAMLGRWAGWLR